MVREGVFAFVELLLLLVIGEDHFTVAFEQSTGANLIQLDFSANLYSQLAGEGSMLSICHIFICDFEHEIGNQLRSKLIRRVVRIRHIPLEVLLNHQSVLPIRQHHIKPQICHVLDCLALPGQAESRPYNNTITRLRLNREVGGVLPTTPSITSARKLLSGCKHSSTSRYTMYTTWMQKTKVHLSQLYCHLHSISRGSRVAKAAPNTSPSTLTANSLICKTSLLSTGHMKLSLISRPATGIRKLTITRRSSFSWVAMASAAPSSSSKLT